MTASWTDEQIRAATPFPKPLGALDAEWNREAGRCFAHVDVTPPERKLLQHIAEYADEVVVARSIHHDNWAATWLLVPMPAHLLALLHNFEAQIEDLEEDADREPEAFDNNDEIEDEFGGDDEPSLGATMAIDQRDAGWRNDGQAASLTDLELDVADDEQNGDLEKSSGDEEPEFVSIYSGPNPDRKHLWKDVRDDMPKAMPPPARPPNSIPVYAASDDRPRHAAKRRA